MEINSGIEDLKKVFNSNPDKFHFEWLTENSFFICLNFSIGSSHLIDTNYGNKKSSIVAYGTLSKS
ncbi:hypothetical protein, partial [Christiangramia aquimixticola]|uniref:hypothetical protein n=1 Tax=Christiangramia aquimixticola TaxID=1697558 RepID=UPI003AA8F5BA